MIKEIIVESYNKQVAHIPSALSMATYIEVLFKEEFIKPYRDKIVLGKPFGSQAYYTLWKELGYLDNLSYSMGVKHDEIDFVDYGEETMGNALGVGAGIALTTDKRVWINLTDATLQMGSTLEAIQFIGHNCLKNIIVTIDYNNMQVTGKTSDIISVKPVISFFKKCGWSVKQIDGHNKDDIKNTFTYKTDTSLIDRPQVYFYKTKKGYGVKCMEDDPVEWHYKKLDENNFRQILKQIQ
jgi:transketolase